MKDSILNSTLMMAFGCAGFLLTAFDFSGMTAQTGMTRTADVVTMEKTVVTGIRLP